MALGLLYPLGYGTASLADMFMEIGGGIRTFVTPIFSSLFKKPEYSPKIANSQRSSVNHSLISNHIRSEGVLEPNYPIDCQPNNNL
jgi:hypothetical protein